MPTTSSSLSHHLHLSPLRLPSLIPSFFLIPILILIFILALPSPVQCTPTTYHISPTGGTTTDCSYSTPCSLSHAISLCNALLSPPNAPSPTCQINAFAGTYSPSGLNLRYNTHFAPVTPTPNPNNPNPNTTPTVLFETTSVTGAGFVLGNNVPDDDDETTAITTTVTTTIPPPPPIAISFSNIQLLTSLSSGGSGTDSDSTTPTPTSTTTTTHPMFIMGTLPTTSQLPIHILFHNILVEFSGGLFASIVSEREGGGGGDTGDGALPFTFQSIVLDLVNVISSDKPFAVTNVVSNRGIVQLNISRCSFVNNTHQGFYLHSYGPISGVVEDTLFDSNWNYYIQEEDLHFGGGIFIRADDAEEAAIGSCQSGSGCVNENENEEDGVAVWMMIRNCSFVGNWAIKGGGAFLMSGGEGDMKVYIENCSFERNLAMYLGGGIYVHAPFGSLREMNVTDCEFESNVSFENGGAVILFVTLGDIRLNLMKSNFLQNSASKDGGAIYALVSSGNIECLIDRCYLTQNSAVLRGGGWYLESCSRNVTSYVTNSVLLENTGFFGGGYASLSSDMLVSLSNATFDGNKGFLGAGGFQFAARLVFRVDQMSVVTRNEAKNNGGGFFVAGREVDVVLDDCLFESNGASNGAGLYLLGNSRVSGYLGDEVQFLSNVATQVGGAISLQYSADRSATFLTVGGSLFDSNEAGTRGGALALQPTSNQDETLLDQGAVGVLLVLSGSQFQSNVAPSGSAISAIFHLLTVSINETLFMLNMGPDVTRSECTVCLTGATEATFYSNVWDTNIGLYSGLYFQNSPQQPVFDGFVRIKSAVIFSADSNYGVYGFASGFKSVEIDDVQAQYCNNGLVSFEDGDYSYSNRVTMTNFQIDRQRNNEVRRSIVGFKKGSIGTVRISDWDIHNDDVSPIFKAQAGAVQLEDVVAVSQSLGKCFEGVSGLDSAVLSRCNFAHCDLLISGTDSLQINASTMTEGVIEVDGETNVVMQTVKVMNGRGIVLNQFDSFVGNDLELVGNNNSEAGSSRGGGVTAIFSSGSREFIIGSGCFIKLNQADMGGGMLLKGDNGNCDIVLGLKDQYGLRSEIMKNTAKFGSGVFVELSHPEKLVFDLEVLLNHGQTNPAQVYFVEQRGERIPYDSIDPHDLVEGFKRFDSSPVSFRLVNPKLECYFEESDVRLFACYIRHVQFLNNDGSIVTILPPEVRFLTDCRGYKVCQQPQIQYWDKGTASIQFYIEYFEISEIPEKGMYNVSMYGFDGVMLQSSYYAYRMFACSSVTDHYKCHHWGWELVVAIVGGSVIAAVIIVCLVLACLVYCQFGTIIRNFFRQLDEGQVRKQNPWKLMSFQMCLSRLVFDILFCCGCSCKEEWSAWNLMATTGESAILKCCCCCCRRRKPKYAVDIGGYEANETLLEEHLDDEDLVQDLSINFG